LILFDGEQEIIMRAFVLLTAIALLAVASSAGAETIASPATYGAANQTGAQCIIGNTGSTSVSPKVSVVDELGNPLQTNSTCGSAPPQFLCSAFASIPSNQAVACVASVPGSTAKLRGSLTIYAGSVALRTSELR
jgi:hypothetical protein